MFACLIFGSAYANHLIFGGSFSSYLPVSIFVAVVVAVIAYRQKRRKESKDNAREL